MNDTELIQALRPMVVRDKFQCLGCGHEHQCSIHGCAILKQALNRLEQLTSPEDNPQLTAEELWEMDGCPVWNDTVKHWAIVDLFWEHGPRTVDARGQWRDLDDLYYRRKPEVVTP